MNTVYSLDIKPITTSNAEYRDPPPDRLISQSVPHIVNLKRTNTWGLIRARGLLLTGRFDRNSKSSPFGSTITSLGLVCTVCPSTGQSNSALAVILIKKITPVI